VFFYGLHASTDENLIQNFSEIFVKIFEGVAAVQLLGTSRPCWEVTAHEGNYDSNSVRLFGHNIGMVFVTIMLFLPSLF